MELKELKCENCGATVKVDSNSNTATCTFCHTTFSVESAKNNGYEFEKGRIQAQKEEYANELNKAQEIFNSIQNKKKFGSIFFVVFAIFFIAILGVIISQIINVSKSEKNSNIEHDIYSFNFDYLNTNGSKSLILLQDVLDDIITNDKTNNRKITVIYGDIKTTNPEEIKNLKISLKENTNCNYDYELSYNYDDDGYIIEAVIEDYTCE